MKDNKLIAEFMGYICSGDDEYLIHPETNYDHSINDEDWFLYSTSWDWLMPVLKKINLKLNPQNYSRWVRINKPTEYLIGEVHQAVVDFIKNQNN